MKKGLCVYPGSFDPITNGHVDIITRAATIFPEVVVAVLHNPAKVGLFPTELRMAMIRRSCEGLSNVRVDSFDGLLVDYMRRLDAGVVVRGLRAVPDFESEFQMAQLNRQLNPDVETLFLMTSPSHGYISSSAVREIGWFGGDIAPFVPACVAQDIRAALTHPETK